MSTDFTIVYKHGNTIEETTFYKYTAAEAVAAFKALHGDGSTVLAIMPTEVFDLLPDASVFAGIFPY